MPRSIDLAEAIHKLRQFCRERHRPPSVEEIRRLFHYRSKNAAAWIVRRLSDKGLLKKDGSGRILLGSLGGVKLLGTVQAGLPAPAEEELLDTLSLDEYLVRRPAETFLVRVTGDSMKDAGIFAGDLVLVERRAASKSGDILIAQVDGEWTMKQYEKKGGRVRLVAANPKYRPIYPKSELVLGGVVVAVVRKYDK